MESIKEYYRIDPNKIYFVKFIFEAYDGIANLTTIDPKLGIINFNISNKCENYVHKVLQDLENEYQISLYKYHRMPDECL